MVRRDSNKKAGVVSILLSILILVGVMGAFTSSTSASRMDGENVTSLSDVGWAGFGCDEKNTHQSPYDTSHVNGSLKWSFDMSNWVWSSASVTGDGRLYIGSTDDNIYALDNNDGDVIWSFETQGGIISSPAIDQDGNIYVGSKDAYLYSLSPDGSLRWKYKTGGDIYSSPAIGGQGNVYVGSDDNYFYAISQSGDLMWRYKSNSWFWSSPSVAHDGTIYVGSGDNNLYAFEPDGDLKWSFSTGNFIYSSPAIGPQGNIYTGSYDGNLYAIDPYGNEVWSYSTGNNIESSPAISDDGTIYIGSNDKNFYAITQNGEKKWSYHTRGKVVSSAAIGDEGTIYFGSYDGVLYSLNEDGSESWKYDTTREIYSSPSIGPNGNVYVGSWSSELYSFTGKEENDPPVPIVDKWQEVEVNLTISGRKGNELTANIYENGTSIEQLSVMKNNSGKDSHSSTLKVDTENNYSMELIYEAEHVGANPVWITFNSGSEGNETSIFTVFIPKDGFNQTRKIDIDDEIVGALEGNKIYFSAKDSYDPDGDIVTYEWAFDDGSTYKGINTSHKFCRGEHHVLLTVTDDQGGQNSVRHDLNITTTTENSSNSPHPHPPSDENKHEDNLPEKPVSNRKNEIFDKEMKINTPDNLFKSSYRMK